MKLKLYIVKQRENTNWNTFDSFVIATWNKEMARNTNPSTGNQFEDDDYSWKSPLNGWCSSVEYVEVQYLGEAADGIKEGIVCASYNAG